MIRPSTQKLRQEMSTQLKQIRSKPLHKAIVH